MKYYYITYQFINTEFKLKHLSCVINMHPVDFIFQQNKKQYPYQKDFSLIFQMEIEYDQYQKYKNC